MGNVNEAAFDQAATSLRAGRSAKTDSNEDERPGEQETPLAALVASTSNLAYISSDRSNPSHIQHDIMEGTASPSPFRFLSEEPLERPQTPTSTHIDTFATGCNASIDSSNTSLPLSESAIPACFDVSQSVIDLNDLSHHLANTTVDLITLSETSPLVATSSMVTIENQTLQAPQSSSDTPPPDGDPDVSPSSTQSEQPTPSEDQPDPLPNRLFGSSSPSIIISASLSNIPEDFTIAKSPPYQHTLGTLPAAVTYADATNLAAQFPNLAPQLLTLPLSSSQTSLLEIANQGQQDASTPPGNTPRPITPTTAEIHTPENPNWAAAPVAESAPKRPRGTTKRYGRRSNGMQPIRPARKNDSDSPRGPRRRGRGNNPPSNNTTATATLTNADTELSRSRTTREAGRGASRGRGRPADARGTSRQHITAGELSEPSLSSNVSVASNDQKSVHATGRPGATKPCPERHRIPSVPVSPASSPGAPTHDPQDVLTNQAQKTISAEANQVSGSQAAPIISLGGYPFHGSAADKQAIIDQLHAHLEKPQDPGVQKQNQPFSLQQTLWNAGPLHNPSSNNQVRNRSWVPKVSTQPAATRPGLLQNAGVNAREIEQFRKAHKYQVAGLNLAARRYLETRPEAEKKSSGINYPTLKPDIDDARDSETSTSPSCIDGRSSLTNSQLEEALFHNRDTDRRPLQWSPGFDRTLLSESAPLCTAIPQNVPPNVIYGPPTPDRAPSRGGSPFRDTHLRTKNTDPIAQRSRSAPREIASHVTRPPIHLAPAIPFQGNAASGTRNDGPIQHLPFAIVPLQHGTADWLPPAPAILPKTAIYLSQRPPHIRSHQSYIHLNSTLGSRLPEGRNMRRLPSGGNFAQGQKMQNNRATGLFTADPLSGTPQYDTRGGKSQRPTHIGGTQQAHSIQFQHDFNGVELPSQALAPHSSAVPLIGDNSLTRG